MSLPKIDIETIEREQGSLAPKVLSEVERFAVCSVPQTPFDTWFGSILEALSEGAFHPFYGPGYILRRDIEERFEEAVAEPIKEYEKDPIAYIETHKVSPREEHPWGNEVVARCRLFIETATPYSVWKFYDAVRRNALAALDEGLVEMAFLGEPSYVARAAAWAREDALRSLIKDLDRGLAYRALARSLEENWRGMPLGNPVAE